MVAVKLKGKITANRQLQVKLPKEIAPGEVEVILLRETRAANRAEAPRRRTRRQSHPAFGIWADRQDLTDSAEYSVQLRRQVESRQDGRH